MCKLRNRVHGARDAIGGFSTLNFLCGSPVVQGGSHVAQAGGGGACVSAPLSDHRLRGRFQNNRFRMNGLAKQSAFLAQYSNERWSEQLGLDAKGSKQ